MMLQNSSFHDVALDEPWLIRTFLVLSGRVCVTPHTCLYKELG